MESSWTAGPARSSSFTANGDGQIEFTAPGVDIKQWSGVGGKSQYAPTKPALDGLARCGAIELASRQSAGNVVALGPTENLMLADPSLSATPPKLPPRCRLVQSEEVADLAVFLFGSSGCTVTGQRLIICAGAFP